MRGHSRLRDARTLVIHADNDGFCRIRIHARHAVMLAASSTTGRYDGFSGSGKRRHEQQPAEQHSKGDGDTTAHYSMSVPHSRALFGTAEPLHVTLTKGTIASDEEARRGDRNNGSSRGRNRV